MQFESIQMNEDEYILGFFPQVDEIVNIIKDLMKKLMEQ